MVTGSNNTIFERDVFYMEAYYKHSDTVEQRKNPRSGISPEVGYVTLGKNGKVADIGNGKALNMSHGGVLLQTPKPLDRSTVVLISFNKDDMDLDAKGRIIYTKMHETTGNYFSGIDFFEFKDQRNVL
jgi:hypothetical protein